MRQVHASPGGVGPTVAAEMEGIAVNHLHSVWALSRTSTNWLFWAHSWFPIRGNPGLPFRWLIPLVDN